MIGRMAIVIALLEFNDLGCAVTPIFLFSNRFYSQLTPHLSKNEQKINVGIQVFWPPDVKACHLAAARRKKLWSLNMNLFFNEPQQLT